MFTIRIINRRNPLRSSSPFPASICKSTGRLLRAFSDGGPVVESKETGDATIDSKPKYSKSVASATGGLNAGKKPRKTRSDAGKPRKTKSDGGKPEESSVGPPKPRKKRKDSGIAKGPLAKKSFANIIEGTRAAPLDGNEKTESRARPEEQLEKERMKIRTSISKKGGKINLENISHIDFSKSRGDKVRQNIVSSELCDDILQRLAPSLEKHKGCDIIDINPGVGLWSSKLHDYLKPRTHILMEPDYKTYLPYLGGLLDQENSAYKLLPLSGIIWNNLNKIESEGHLPHQKLRPLGDPELEKPNDTLLVTANLGYWPRRSYIGFPSITNLVVHQLLTASRAHSIFQGYGQVRMLIWMHDLEKRIVLPRLVTNRRKSTVEAEISCTYIHEVAGADQDQEVYRRERAIDIASSQRVAPIMASAGLHTPTHRAGAIERDARDIDSNVAASTGVRRPFEDELEDLEARLARKEFPIYHDEQGKPQYVMPENRRAAGGKRTLTPEFERIQTLRWRQKSVSGYDDALVPILERYEALEAEWAAIRAAGGPDAEAGLARVEEELQAWRRTQDMESMKIQKALSQRIEERRGSKAEPKLLMWDRRTIEPLIVQPEEFLPRQPMALLDFQPRSIWPSLRANGLGNYDYFEFMLAAIFVLPKQSVLAGLRALSPGAEEWIVPRCPSLTNVGKGGVIDLEMLSVRSLTEKMLEEMFAAFMSWPFRPTKAQMLARGGSQDVHGEADEEKLGGF